MKWKDLLNSMYKIQFQTLNYILTCFLLIQSQGISVPKSGCIDGLSYNYS